MSKRTAKLFVNGGSQAVRLPAEFRFVAANEVYVRRDATTGDVILSAKNPERSWPEFFELRAGAAPVEEFLADRPLNEPLRPPGTLRSRGTQRPRGTPRRRK